MRKTLSIILCFAVLLSFNLSANAQDITNSDSTILNDNTLEPLVDPETTNEIFTEYEKEINYVESKYNLTISVLTQETLDLLSNEAAQNLKNEDYRFSKLMTQLILECERAKLANTYSTNAAGTVSPNSITVVKDYDIVKGMYITEVSKGTTKQYTDTATFEMSVGTEVSGFTLGSSYSRSFTYSVNGPESGLKLNNGSSVTHNVCFAVLYGPIYKDGLGRYYVPLNGSSVIDYTARAHLGVPTYCENENGTSLFYFANPNALQECIEDFPSPFLSN